jgi:hypothetical protein
MRGSDGAVPIPSSIGIVSGSAPSLRMRSASRSCSSARFAAQRGFRDQVRVSIVGPAMAIV